MLHITLRQLKVFESVARHLSFSRAAEDLHLTQPGVSMQIKQLEESIDLPLFEQMGKKDCRDHHEHLGSRRDGQPGNKQ